MVNLVMEYCFFMAMPHSQVLYYSCCHSKGYLRRIESCRLFAPSDYYLSSKLKKFLRGKNFSRDNETIDTVGGLFE